MHLFETSQGVCSSVSIILCIAASMLVKALGDYTRTQPDCLKMDARNAGVAINLRLAHLPEWF